MWGKIFLICIFKLKFELKKYKGKILILAFILEISKQRNESLLALGLGLVPQQQDPEWGRGLASPSSGGLGAEPDPAPSEPPSILRNLLFAHSRCP